VTRFSAIAPVRSAETFVDECLKAGEQRRAIRGRTMQSTLVPQRERSLYEGGHMFVKALDEVICDNDPGLGFAFDERWRP
jgi:hypothetical protein